jgi:tetratricopeptide (TPR) repeat protein
MRALVALMLLSGVALADEAMDKARIHLQAGIAYYDEARYDEAVREMEAAYRLKPVADLQYNLAECYERLGRPTEAVAAYKKYLDTKPGADDRGLIESRIKNLQARGESGAAPHEKVVLKTIVVYRELPPPPGRVARWAAWGALALGLGGLAAGIAGTVQAAKAANDVASTANPAMPAPFDGPARDAQTRLDTFTVVAGIGYGVAALGAGACAGLYLLGNKIDREAKKAQLSFGLGSVSVRGRF